MNKIARLLIASGAAFLCLPGACNLYDEGHDEDLGCHCPVPLMLSARIQSTRYVQHDFQISLCKVECLVWDLESADNKLHTGELNDLTARIEIKESGETVSVSGRWPHGNTKPGDTFQLTVLDRADNRTLLSESIKTEESRMLSPGDCADQDRFWCSQLQGKHEGSIPKRPCDAYDCSDTVNMITHLEYSGFTSESVHERRVVACKNGDCDTFFVSSGPGSTFRCEEATIEGSSIPLEDRFMCGVRLSDSEPGRVTVEAIGFFPAHELTENDKYVLAVYFDGKVFWRQEYSATYSSAAAPTSCDNNGATCPVAVLSLSPQE